MLEWIFKLIGLHTHDCYRLERNDDGRLDLVCSCGLRVPALVRTDDEARRVLPMARAAAAGKDR